MKLEKITHLRLVHVSGEDAKTFLQGQLSNDINALEDAWQFSAYCNPKGRALATLMVWESLDGIYLLLEESLIETIIQRLRMYVMRSKVVFEEVAAHMLGVFDHESAEGLLQVLAEQDDLNLKQTAQKTRFQTTLSDNIDFLNFGERSMVVDRTLSIIGQSGHHWIDSDVMDALPRVTAESTEMFIPQMLNMDLVNGISFKKGCYTGQEIIARMHYLGKLKQRGFVCEAQGDTEISIGEKIINSEGKSVGNVANIATYNGNVRLIFAVLRIDTQSDDINTNDSNASHEQAPNKTLFLQSGATLEVSANQPYAFSQ